LGGFFVMGYIQWIFLAIAATVIGLSKAGIKGVDMLNVTLMAIVFGSKASTGYVLPLLCVADIMAVIYYKRHVSWPHFKNLIPSMIIGVLLGVFIGIEINETLFRKLMSLIVITTIILLLWTEFKKNLHISHNFWFNWGMGLISGFTTMIGNLAGAFSNIYFLASKLPKNEFIGTAAWLFLVINLFKLPFQILVWKNINLQTLVVDVKILPFVFIGFLLGIFIVNKINEQVFRKLVMAITLIGSIFLLFS
jgi:uncharacterized membrane protein YfcA